MAEDDIFEELHSEYSDFQMRLVMWFYELKLISIPLLEFKISQIIGLFFF